ncbi:MAG: hypothetical protein H8E29_15950 [Anaerolineales bacterium]|uniref:Uncharacterized protein n=1 Tax=Candidatus Desulfolinea nitratireducens TaxID=2841698 RepID=A0A8J6NJB2_9CHLR|nr:hypothetical protein [Candidatus Desulfolinea nitratireducens]
MVEHSHLEPYEKDYIISTLQELEQVANKDDEEINESLIHRQLLSIELISPDIWDALLSVFLNPSYVFAKGLTKKAKEISLSKNN